MIVRRQLSLLIAVLSTALVCAPLGAQSIVDTTRVPASEPRPFAAFSASAESLRASIVALARAQVGTKYVRGGATPERGFDCSGLVKYVMAAMSVSLPRTANQQAHSGEKLARDKSVLRPGDLLTFGRGTRASHIGIYVGDGRFVHASSVAGRVIESPIDRGQSRLIKPWKGARRVVVSER